MTEEFKCDSDRQPFAFYEKNNKIIYMINEYKNQTVVYCINLTSKGYAHAFQQIICNFNSFAISALPVEYLDNVEISKYKEKLFINY